MPSTLDNTIQKWLLLREEVMVSIESICHLRPFQELAEKDLSENIQCFFQQLIDYLAFGHFNVLSQMKNQIEQHSLSYACYPEELLQALSQNTLIALDLNEKYQTNQKHLRFERDFSILVEQLAERFSWEDKFVSTYRMTQISSETSKTA